MNFGVIFAAILSIFYINSLLAAKPFPPTTPYRTGMLRVDNVHQIYWEESGNPNGYPVLFLHGGPGFGTEESYRTFFDPGFYRIILFDQRGSGKSVPNGCLTNNTTWDLVEDINKLREFLSIDRCLLFGGSWGSTLALTYAIKYPENISGLILRAIFLCRQKELDWFYQEGANELSPNAWNKFVGGIPKEKRDVIASYHDKLHSEAYWTRINAAADWVLWEFANIQAIPDIRVNLLLNSKVFFYAFAIFNADKNLTQACMENHYFHNKGFFETDNWIIENIQRIKNVPGIIIQGKCDQICPWENAKELHLNWPASTFVLVPNAGHASNEPAILEAVIEATEDFKKLF